MSADDSGRTRRPPPVLIALIRLSLPSDDRDALVREIEALWLTRVRLNGRAAANRWLARQAFGFLLRVGPVRFVPSLHLIESIVGDARISARTLLREPTFVLSFVMTLAVATGVLSAVYSAANWLLLRPVPGVRAAEQLITLQLNQRGRNLAITWDVSQPDLTTLRERIPQISQLAAMTPLEVDVRVRLDPPRRIPAELATSNYFSVLRARMYAGRPFLPEDDRAAASPVAVVSHDLARSIAANPADAVGMDVRVNGAVLRVVGVTEAGFRGAELPGLPLLWLPVSAQHIVDPGAEPTALTNRAYGVWRRMIGRVDANTSPAQIEAAANAVADAVRAEFHGGHSYMAATQVLRAFPGVGLDPGARPSVRRTLGLLFAAAAFLLCLAIANLTNLALIQTLKRTGATAVRFALGASRARVVRGLFIETLMLSAAGGLLAMLFAVAWGRWLERARLTESGASLDGMHIDLRVALFAMAASFTATVVAFLRPAVLTRWRPLEHLMRRGVAGERHRLRTLLVGVQVALSVVLLVTATLLSRTIANLRSIDLGFSTDRLLTVAANPQIHGYDMARTDEMARVAVLRLRENPGVVAAGVISPPALRSSYYTGSLRRLDDVDGKKTVVGAAYYVSPGFIETLGLRVLAGDAKWRADSGSVVVTRSMLRQLHPELSPAAAIGQIVMARRGAPVLIAAVVEDVKLSNLTSDAPPTMFRPLRSGIVGEPLSIYVRSTSEASALAAAVSRTMAAVAPDVPLYDVRTARQAVDMQFTARRIMAVVASTLGALGVVLAAIGLYGVLANVVASGQREIAIRSALGAAPQTILTQVLARGFVPVGLGIVAGAVGAIGAGRLVASQLFGLGALDPIAYAWALVVTALLALLACLPPAYRATRVSIVQVLRGD